MIKYILGGVFLVNIILATPRVQAQNSYYWYGSQKIELEKVPDKYYVLVDLSD